MMQPSEHFRFFHHHPVHIHPSGKFPCLALQVAPEYVMLRSIMTGCKFKDATYINISHADIHISIMRSNAEQRVIVRCHEGEVVSWYRGWCFYMLQYAIKQYTSGNWASSNLQFRSVCWLLALNLHGGEERTTTNTAQCCYPYDLTALQSLPSSSSAFLAFLDNFLLEASFESSFSWKRWT